MRFSFPAKSLRKLATEIRRSNVKIFFCSKRRIRRIFNVLCIEDSPDGLYHSWDYDANPQLGTVAGLKLKNNNIFVEKSQNYVMASVLLHEFAHYICDEGGCSCIGETGSTCEFHANRYALEESFNRGWGSLVLYQMRTIHIGTKLLKFSKTEVGKNIIKNSGWILNRLLIKYLTAYRRVTEDKIWDKCEEKYGKQLKALMKAKPPKCYFEG